MADEECEHDWTRLAFEGVVAAFCIKCQASVIGRAEYVAQFLTKQSPSYHWLGADAERM